MPNHIIENPVAYFLLAALCGALMLFVLYAIYQAMRAERCECSLCRKEFNNEDLVTVADKGRPTHKLCYSCVTRAFEAFRLHQRPKGPPE